MDTCETFYLNPAFNLSGITLFYTISKCLEYGNPIAALNQKNKHTVDEFLTVVAANYFADASQVMFLY